MRLPFLTTTRVPDATVWMANRPTAFFIMTLIVMSLVVPGGCNVLSTPSIDTLTVVTDESTVRLAEDLLNSYENRHRNSTTTLAIGGTDLTAESISSGKADAAILFNTSVLEDVQSVTIGYDPLIIIVHPSNPIGELKLATVASIMGGSITTWAAISGSSQPIDLVVPPDGSASRNAFTSLLPSTGGFASYARIMPSSAAIVQYVGESEHSLGFVPRSALQPEVKAVAIENVDITASGVSEYLLTAQIVFVTKATPRGRALRLLEWILSRDGQSVIARHIEPIH